MVLLYHFPRRIASPIFTNLHPFFGKSFAHCAQTSLTGGQGRLRVSNSARLLGLSAAAALISGVDESVRQRAPGGERGVGAAHDVLALVPDHGAGAAVEVHGLHAVVLGHDGRAVRHADADRRREPALNEQGDDLAVLRLAEAGARLQVGEAAAGVDDRLPVDDHGGRPGR